jgi:multiple sugar transport system ATP-binding protein
MSELQLKHVRKSYGNFEVIKGVDLDIKTGEFVVFVGPSGCGKSTLLRMIAGLEEITSGDLTIGGERMNDVDPSKRGIAMVFQSYALYPHMTVRENMGFALRFAGVPKAEIAQRVGEAANILELGPLLDRKPKQLSGGQRQRVAIGRAIVRQPDVFLFDEPLSNLDAKLRIEMRTEIKLLHRRLQTTAVYVTHDQVEAMTMADRVVVMNQGRIEQAADPITLYEAPANLFVAAFIGAPSMNFLEGRLERGDGGMQFIADGDVAVAIPENRAEKLGAYVGKAVVLGIRPEHTMATDANAPTVRLIVRDIEPLGPHTLALGRVGPAAFTAQVHAASRIGPDDQIAVPIETEKMHFFLKETGGAIGR